jgi:very-short-patch-repair endonuclease
MWNALRMGRAGAVFRREHPINPYRADFACLNLGIVIEMDGGQHLSSEALAYDRRRDAFMAGAGWQVLRIQNTWWFEHPAGVLRSIDETIQAAKLERETLFAFAYVKTPMNRLRVLARRPLQSLRDSFPINGEAVVAPRFLACGEAD